MPSPLKKLFKPEKVPLFPFIDGLRALSILWIILIFNPMQYTPYKELFYEIQS